MNQICARCGANPARDPARFKGHVYCNEDSLERMSCYERMCREDAFETAFMRGTPVGPDVTGLPS